MARKIVIEKDKLFECPACGYRWTGSYDLSFDEEECCPCCPNCGELIEDGDNSSESMREMEDFSMGYKSIEEQKQIARNTNELLDHLSRIIEQNDERFSFEWLVGGEHATMEIFDKEKKIGYAVKIEPIEYDENGEPTNL